MLALVFITIKSVQAADIQFQPYNVILNNTGNKVIYVALAVAQDHYNNILGMTVNGKTTKQEIYYPILPAGVVTLKLQPLQNYFDYTNNYYMRYDFAFGLSQQSATYNLNDILFQISFNAPPLQYSLSQSSKAIIRYDVNNITTEYYIDSDSQYFVY